ncbi:GNAT family N-acetyltransferase [Aliiroseovarius sp. F47248L]|uniref:GNAT family N-acetyltransferase n=1 Tax=Aliiroseovarius sp. F47248L TaxID=2926420 RepID=UPI001FF360CD|nr:GNAT family N-acetyltransferase [Aliiroseovarius sp. F47248L]MCK0137535.1 GNAT family N-acetyltransferase [Aliiroseovarius sp. F47248L]
METIHATLEDAAEISAFLKELADLGKRQRPWDEAYVREYYIGNPDSIQCSVAVGDDGAILGLQSLTRAAEGNVYDVTPGWGIIGTHVKPSAARRGVGRALFAATIKAAQNAGIGNIDATIGATNGEGLAYYEAMGFRTYRSMNGAICKMLDVPFPSA